MRLCRVDKNPPLINGALQSGSVAKRKWFTLTILGLKIKSQQAGAKKCEIK